MTDIYHCLMQSVKFSLIKRFNWRQAGKQSHSITQKLPNFQKQRHSWLLSLPWWSIQSERQAWVYIGIFAIHWVTFHLLPQQKISEDEFALYRWKLIDLSINWSAINCLYSSIWNFFFWLASKLEWAITTIHKVPIVIMQILESLSDGSRNFPLFLIH